MGGDRTAAAALRSLRAAARLTQEQLAERAGLHVRTIRGLETGRIAAPRRTSLERIAAAVGMTTSEREHLLSEWHLPDESTLSTVASWFGPDGDADESLDNLVDMARAASSILTLSEVVRVGADRQIQSRSIEQVSVARRDGVSGELTFLEPPDPTLLLDEVLLTDLQGCAISRDLTFPAHNVRVVELSFDRPLRRGETHLFRFRVDFADAYRVDQSGATPNCTVLAGFAHPGVSYVLQVQFDGAAVPRRCHQVSLSKPTSAPRNARQLPIDRWHTVHMAVPTPRPGSYGISWEW
ncbi:MAG: helix-turn-helix domain-containing protein [Jatrophihabitans sp.]